MQRYNYYKGLPMLDKVTDSENKKKETVITK